MGTKSTPPPTPPSTARMPRMKVTINRASGQIHQGVVDAGTTEGDEETACASLCSCDTGGAGGTDSCDENATVAEISATIIRNIINIINLVCRCGISYLPSL
jgi:hypothetical protein